MNDQNRYEEVPQKENKFVKGLKAFGNYLKYVFVDFFNSFKYNNMKLAAILFAMPGILLGFFMFAHVPTIRHVQVSYDSAIAGSDVKITPDLTNSTITLDKYTIGSDTYNNVRLSKVSYDDMKAMSDDDFKKVFDTNETFNQNNYPMNGYAELTSQATQLAKPVVNSFTDASSASEKTSDSYVISVEYGSTKNEIKEVGLFVFEQVQVGTKDVEGVQTPVYEYFFIESIYRTFDAEKPAINSFNTLSSEKKYAVAVKSIASYEEGSEYYSSALSDLLPITVEKNGSKVSSEDYDDNNTKYIAYSGVYVVDQVDGSAPSDNAKKLVVQINPNGYVEYRVDGSDTVRAKASSAGSYLESIAVKTNHIIPFDFSGIAIFFLTLLGFLNVFLSLELSKKKNLGTVVKCALTTLAIVLLGAAYVYAIVATDKSLGPDKLILNNPKTNQPLTTLFDTNAIISISAVIGSAVFSIAGLVLAFINYDRTYEKVDR